MFVIQWLFFRRLPHLNQGLDTLQEVFDVEEIQMIYLNRDDNVRVTVLLENDAVTEVVTESIEE